MAAVQCVQVQSAGVVGRDKLGPDVVLGEAVIDAQILDPGSEALVQPQMGPPFLSEQKRRHRATGFNHFALLFTRDTFDCVALSISRLFVNEL